MTKKTSKISKPNEIKKKTSEIKKTGNTKKTDDKSKKTNAKKKDVVDDIMEDESVYESDVESDTDVDVEDETNNVNGVEGENDEDKNADKLDNGDYGDEEVADDVVVDEDKCMYEFANVGDEDDEKEEDREDDEQVDDLYFDDDDVVNSMIVQSPALRQAKPILTKYERVRALGTRTKQLSLGAKPMIKNVDHLTPREVALLELKHGVMPYIIEKIMPNGNREYWKISELVSLN